MSVAHQSLKELAQRPDEEVVQLWLEQRGLTMHSEDAADETTRVPIFYKLPDGTVHKVQDRVLFKALTDELYSLRQQLSGVKKELCEVNTLLAVATQHVKVGDAPRTKPAHIPPPGQSAPADPSTQQPGVSSYITQPSMHPIWPNKELEQFARIDAINKYAVILEEFPKLKLELNDLRLLAGTHLKNQEVHQRAQNVMKEELLKINLRLGQIDKLLRAVVPDRLKDV